MDNNLVDRAIAALDNAGIEVVKYSGKPRGALKLKVVFGSPGQDETTLYNTLPAPSLHVEKAKRCPGETFDLSRVLGTSDWRHTLGLVQKSLRAGLPIIDVGDFVRVSFEVPAAEYQGVKFPKLTIKDAMVRIVDITDGIAVFNFEEILFESAINATDTNYGGFMDSALSHYLNTEFNDAMGISDLLTTNHDGMNYSLLTAQELFGKSEYWEGKTNWNNGEQIPCFESEKNRVKDFEKETRWYWTSASASSAANFCSCHSSGDSGYHSASAVGGVAPAFCVA